MEVLSAYLENDEFCILFLPDERSRMCVHFFNHIIVFSVSENPIAKFQAPIYKNVELHIFCQKTDHGCVFICIFLFFCCFFFQGSSSRPSGPRMT